MTKPLGRVSRRRFLKTSTLLGLGLGVPGLMGCSRIRKSTPDSSVAKQEYWGVDLEYISADIRPGTDFFAHVNEGWLTSTALPPGRSTHDAAWAVQDGIIDDIDRMIGAARGGASGSSPESRIGDVYASYLDANAAQQKGVGPILAELNAIVALETYEEIARWMGDPRANAVFNLRVQPPSDMKGGHVLSLAQYRVTGLGLPGQAYYESDEADYATHRDTYTRYIAAVLTGASVSDAENRAKAVLELETAFAKTMWDFAALRDAGAAFNLIPVQDLDDHAPGFPWTSFLDGRDLNGVEMINISVGAIVESAALFRTFSVDDWRSFLAFHWIDTHAEFLSPSLADAQVAFDTALWGVESQDTSRKSRAVGFVQRFLGDDVGALYVHAHLSDETRKQVHDISEAIRRAFREQVASTTWLDEATRSEALAKIDTILFEIGEPGETVDWSDLITDREDLVGNFKRIVEHGWRQERARIGQPLTRLGDWNMKPHRVGLGYHQQYNKIFITAGMLQPPFFNPNADPAVNFGAIGHLIGHEFGHALDDQGSKFDRHGALRDWWSGETREEFERRTTRLIEQFAAYQPLPGVTLSSEQMIGEIVADLAGMCAAFRAYQIYAEERYPQGPPVLDGYTGSQRFFLGAAQQSRSISTDAALEAEAQRSAHPPARYRLNGILLNMVEWQESFGIEPDDELYREPSARIRLW